MAKQMKYHITADIHSTGERMEMDADSISPMMKVLRERHTDHFEGQDPDFELPDGRSIRTQLLDYRVWTNGSLTLMLHVYRNEPLPVQETAEQAIKDYLSANKMPLDNFDIIGITGLIANRLLKFVS